MLCLIKKKKIPGLFTISNLDQVYPNKNFPQKRIHHYFSSIQYRHEVLLDEHLPEGFSGPFFFIPLLLKVFWDQTLTISFPSTNSDTYFLCLQSLSANFTTYKIPTSVLIALWWHIYSNSW